MKSLLMDSRESLSILVLQKRQSFDLKTFNHIFLNDLTDFIEVFKFERKQFKW